MYQYIISFLSIKQSNQYYPFNQDYRRGYVNCWVNNIKNYKP